jgi:hypothetical protein
MKKISTVFPCLQLHAEVEVVLRQEILISLSDFFPKFSISSISSSVFWMSSPSVRMFSF